MPALSAGTSAPALPRSTADGKRFSFEQALKRGPVVAAFFKISCPVCQLTFPYLERIYQAYPRDNVTFVGVSQDEDNYTRSFAREYGITFPLLPDDVEKYPVSDAYELTHVPTIFLITPQREIQLTIVGWDRGDMEKLNELVAQAAGAAVKPLFHRGEDVPDSKAG